jgi:hypothetical protein
MALREQLSSRIGKTDIQQICHQCQGPNNPLIEELYSLMFDSDKRVSDNAAWVMSHIDDAKRVFFSII